MESNASGVLSVMLRELTGIQVAANNLTTGLNGIRTAALFAGEAFVGLEITKGIWHAIEGNRELNKELEKTKQLGGDFASHIGETRAAAFRTANEAPTSVVSDNVRLARELGTTIGKPEAAEQMLPEAVKAAYVIHNFTGEDTEDIIKNLVRTADARAQIYAVGADGKEHVDPTRLAAEFNAAARGLILGGGLARSNDFLQEARQASTVAKSQTPEAFYAAGTEAGIAMGFSKLGTAETSLMAQFIGGTMTKKVAEHLTEAGLLHSDEWHSGKSGGVVINPGVAKRFDPMLQDPVAWLETGEGGTAIRAYAMKEGISITAGIMQLFGRQTSQRLASEAMSNEPQFARAREIYGNIPSVQSQYDALHNNDLGTNLTEVSAAWKSFTQAFSDAGTPLVIPILHGLTGGIHDLTSVFADHPTIAKDLIGLTGAMGIFLAMDGSIKLFSLVAGPFAGALGQITGVSGLAATAGGISAVAGALTRLGLVVGIASAVKGELESLSDSLYDKIHGAGSAKQMHADLEKGNPFNPDYKTGLPDLNDRLRDADHQSYFLRYNKPADQTATAGGSKPTTQDPMPVSLGASKLDLGEDTLHQLAAAFAAAVAKMGLSLDGKKVGEIVAGRMADQMSRAPSSGTAPDMRLSPWMPGMMGTP